MTRRSSSTTTVGLRPCPHCNGGARRPCKYCDEKKFITADRVGETYLLWLKEQMGTKDTDPDLGPVSEPEEKKS